MNLVSTHITKNTSTRTTKQLTSQFYSHIDSGLYTQVVLKRLSGLHKTTQTKKSTKKQTCITAFKQLNKTTLYKSSVVVLLSFNIYYSLDHATGSHTGSTSMWIPLGHNWLQTINDECNVTWKMMKRPSPWTHMWYRGIIRHFSIIGHQIISYDVKVTHFSINTYNEKHINTNNEAVNIAIL